MIRRMLLLTINACLITYIWFSSTRTMEMLPLANTRSPRSETTDPIPEIEPVRIGGGALDLFKRKLPDEADIAEPIGDEHKLRLVGVISGSAGAIALVEYGSERTVTRASPGQSVGSGRITVVSERSIDFERDGIVETIYLDPIYTNPQ